MEVLRVPTDNLPCKVKIACTCGEDFTIDAGYKSIYRCDISGLQARVHQHRRSAPVHALDSYSFEEVQSFDVRVWSEDFEVEYEMPPMVDADTRTKSRSRSPRRGCGVSHIGNNAKPPM